jgi:hypothetical protein
MASIPWDPENHGQGGGLQCYGTINADGTWSLSHDCYEWVFWGGRYSSDA